MAASHYAYNMLKMSGPISVISVPGDKKQEDDNHDKDDESGEQEFQKAIEAMCVDGGASLHTSHHKLKQWAHEITAMEPSFDA